MVAGQRDLFKASQYLRGIINIFSCNRGHPNDGIHRRTDIMGHGGEKPGFCHVGILRLLHALFKLPVNGHDMASIQQQEKEKADGYIKKHMPVKPYVNQRFGLDITYKRAV